MTRLWTFQPLNAFESLWKKGMKRNTMIENDSDAKLKCLIQVIRRLPIAAVYWNINNNITLFENLFIAKKKKWERINEKKNCQIENWKRCKL